jgi:hypothetical protein
MYSGVASVAGGTRIEAGGHTRTPPFSCGEEAVSKGHTLHVLVLGDNAMVWQRSRRVSELAATHVRWRASNWRGVVVRPDLATTWVGRMQTKAGLRRVCGDQVQLHQPLQ